jgi:hypothetical protein
MSVLAKFWSTKERRKDRRLYHMQFPSFIQLKDEQRGCTVSDVSETGARIALEQALDLPDEFILHLSGTVPRPCKVVWRDTASVGITWSWTGDPSVMRAWRAIFRESDV